MRMRLTNEGIIFEDDTVETGVVFLPDVPTEEIRQIEETVACEYCGVSTTQLGGTCPFCGAPLPARKQRFIMRDRTGIETELERRL